MAIKKKDAFVKTENVVYDAREIFLLLDNIEKIGTKKKLKPFAKKITAPLVFKDIIDHFDKEKGPDAPWSAWSQRYAEFMKKIGKGGNKILQDTGTLRQSFSPGNLSGHREAKNTIIWFNKVPYAARHNQGKSDSQGKPRRFMYLSNRGFADLASAFLQYAAEGDIRKVRI